MAQTNGKSHFGLGFFIGFFTTFIVIAAALGITGAVLYNKYEPMAAEKEEGFFEEYTNAIVTPILAQKSGLTATLDYKYVTWETKADVPSLYLHGKATVKNLSDLSDFSLEVSLVQSDYEAIERNLKTNPDQTLDLAPNYGAIGLYYITNGCANKDAKFKTLILGAATWSLA
ncbi:MAG: hypothetical protein WCS90_01085 [Bacilli bacterium]